MWRFLGSAPAFVDGLDSREILTDPDSVLSDITCALPSSRAKPKGRVSVLYHSGVLAVWGLFNSHGPGSSLVSTPAGGVHVSL